ncbi:adenosine receptor A3-like [Clytia hemisphaerica]|uniref:adenosine receptor A3-like n=1 Tax=Clytia hemisphaerica TaxID=252671 RepID=UPI0034D5136B
MNKTDKFCQNVYDKRLVLYPAHKTFILVYSFIIVGFANFIANVLVIYTLKKTKQYVKPTLRIILYLSICDVAISLTAPASMLTLMIFVPEKNCIVELTIKFFNSLSGYISACGTSLIAFDRFASVKYLNEYKIKMAKHRINIYMLLITLAAFTVTLLSTLGSVYDFYTVSILISSIFGSIQLITTTSLYFSAKRLVRRSRRRTRFSTHDKMALVDHKMTFLANKYMASVAVFYSLYTLTVSMNTILYKESYSTEYKSWLNLCMFFGIQIAFTNSFTNALIFLVVNKKAKRCLLNTVIPSSVVEKDSKSVQET